MVKFADVDLQENLDEPVPWRRVYGFALNSHLLDHGFLFGSIAVVVVWLFVPSAGLVFSNLESLKNAPISGYETWLLGLLAVGTLFLGGEIDRRDVVHAKLGILKPIKVPVFASGLILLGAWVWLNRGSIDSNASLAISQPYQIIAVIIAIPLVAFLLILKQTKGKTQPAII